MVEETKKIKISQEQFFQMYNIEKNKMNLLQQNIQMTQNINEEQLKAINTLKEIKKIKDKEKILIPLGAGAFVETEIKATDKVKASIKEDILIEQNIGEVIAKLEENNKKVQEQFNRLIAELNSQAANIQNMERLMQAMASAQRKEQQSKDAPIIE